MLVPLIQGPGMTKSKRCSKDVPFLYDFIHIYKSNTAGDDEQPS
jgi:hypothetical protein